MKFTCNNCGFTAEVPDTMNACPMCASQNVSFSKDDEENNERKVKNTANISDGVEPSKEETTKKEPLKKASPEKPEKKKNITLNDEFFDSKPNKEHEEIAKVIKELYPETTENKGKKSIPNLGIIGGVAGGIVVVIIIMVFVFSGRKEIDSDTKENTEKVASIKKEPEKTPEPQNEEKIEETEEIISEIEEEIEEEIAKEIEKRKAPAKKRTVAKAPVKRAAPKAPVKKQYPKPNTAELYKNYLQAGHKAVSERRFNDALREYNNASKTRPREGAVYKFLGITHASMQNQKQACVNYRKYIQLSPNAPDKAQVEALIEACP
jgi:hypothetical protein